MYKIIDHTADVGIEVRSETLEGLFEDAAKGMFSLLFDIKMIDEKIEERINLQAPDIETLLVRWLNELTYKCFYEKKIYKRFNVKIIDNSLDAIIYGEKKDEISFPFEIKSATYHNLKIQKINNSYHATIIFDV